MSSDSFEDKKVFFIVDGNQALRLGVNAFSAQYQVQNCTILNCYAHLWGSSGVNSYAQLGKFHPVMRAYNNDKSNQKRMVADLALMKDLNFKRRRHMAIHLFKRKWIECEEEKAVRYLEKSFFTHDTRTWALCDREQTFVTRSNQGGERDHQVVKVSLRAMQASLSHVLGTKVLSWFHTH